MTNNITFNTNLRKIFVYPNILSMWNKRLYKVELPSKQESEKKDEKTRKIKKETKKTYIVCDNKNMETSNELEKEEEANIYFMEKHEDEEVNIQTSYFTYNESFCICKLLGTESNKLELIISTYKNTISFL